MSWTAAIWAADGIRVVTESSEFGWSSAVSPQDRYAVRLASDCAGRLYVRAVDAQQPLWVSRDKGRTFEPIPPLADPLDAISVYGYKVHRRAGVVTALDREGLWCYDATIGRWRHANCRRICMFVT